MYIVCVGKGSQCDPLTIQLLDEVLLQGLDEPGEVLIGMGTQAAFTRQIDHRGTRYHLHLGLQAAQIRRYRANVLRIGLGSQRDGDCVLRRRIGRYRRFGRCLDDIVGMR